MTTSLDRRAEAAAAAVRAAVADLEPPPGSAPEAPRRRWPVLVAALVLLVAAIGGAVLLQRDDGDTVVAGPGGDVFRLVVDDVPDGMRPAAAYDLPAPGSTETDMQLFGRGGNDDPFRDGDLAVVVLHDDFGLDGLGGGVPVRGVDGSYSEGGATGASLAWTEEGVGSVSMSSRSLSRDELVALADSLRRDGDRLVLDRPPDGYELVADVDGSPAPGLGAGAVVGNQGAAVSYRSGDLERWLSVTTTTEAPGLMDFVRWIGGPDGRPTTVRRHDGWLAPVPFIVGSEAGVLLGWQEAPAVFVTVTAGGLDEAAVRRAAESLRPATDAEWDGLLALGEDEPADEGADLPTIARGDGWRYSQDIDRAVCFEVRAGGGVAGGSCSGPGALDDPQLYEGTEDGDTGRWLHGRVPDDVARVSVHPAGDEPVVVDTVAAARGPGRAWAALVPGAEGSVTITALGADGAEVDTTVVDVQPGWTTP